MRAYQYTKELYKAFLQVSSVRYSGLVLSEVSPTEVSLDRISRWLRHKEFRPRGIWKIIPDFIFSLKLKRETPVLINVKPTNRLNGSPTPFKSLSTSHTRKH